MGLLDGGIADSIYRGFKGKLLTGTLRKRSAPESGALDQGGDPIDPAVPDDHPFEGFIDRFSDFAHAQAGIPRTDLKLFIFCKSLAAGVVPERNDIAQITGPGGSIYEGRWFQIRDAKTDPAGALWDCQASEIEAPQ